jgi:hypothetical protein
LGRRRRLEIKRAAQISWVETYALILKLLVKTSHLGFNILTVPNNFPLSAINVAPLAKVPNYYFGCRVID